MKNWILFLSIAAMLLASCATKTTEKELVVENADKEKVKAFVTKKLLLQSDTLLSKTEGDDVWFDRHFMDSTQGQRLIWRFRQTGKDVRVSIRCFMVLEFGENEVVFEESHRDNCDEYRSKIGFKIYDTSLKGAVKP